MGKRILGLLAAAIVAVAVQAQAQPTNRLDAILARQEIRIGTTGDYKPFTYLNPETKGFEGIDIDMAEAMGKALGVKVTFVRTSWPSLAKDFQADAFDIALGGVSINTDRAKLGFFSLAYNRDGKAAIARCTDKDKFTSLAAIDQPTTRVVVNPGGTNQRFAVANLKQAPITVYDDNVTIFDQIVQNKADVMITDGIETLLQQKLRPSLCALNADKPFDFSEKGYWMPRDIVLKEWVDTWLHAALNNGTYAAIWKKHLE
jgi:cyclohexadienyl dehydratase